MSKATLLQALITVLLAANLFVMLSRPSTAAGQARIYSVKTTSSHALQHVLSVRAKSGWRLHSFTRDAGYDRLVVVMEK